MPVGEVVLRGGIRLVRPLHRHVCRRAERSLAAAGITVGRRAVPEWRHERPGPQGHDA